MNLLFIWGEGRGVSLGQKDGLGGLPAPSVVLSAGGIRNTLFLLLALQKWQLGFFFDLFVSCCP